MSAPRVSVVVRSKDEERAIGATLAALSEQEVSGEVEVIVVDSGSTDSTVAIARGFGIDPIEIPAESFTYGGSLNIGCARAEAPIIVALSAHAVPTDSGWLGRMLAAFEGDRVACACGYDNGPTGSPLTGRLEQDLELARSAPDWGYSNASGGFRAELWQRRRFREDMPGSEDKEWAWHWLEHDWRVLIDPALAVAHDHGQDPLVETYRRAHREHEGLAMFRPPSSEGLGRTLAVWWGEREGRSSATRARLSPRRISRLLGVHNGTRAGRRRVR